MEEKNLEERLKEIAKLAVPAARQSWGGIGGSGKHAAEMIAELEAFTKKPELKELLEGGRQSWGGIGGSGKHAAELEPEIERK